MLGSQVAKYVNYMNNDTVEYTPTFCRIDVIIIVSLLEQRGRGVYYILLEGSPNNYSASIFVHC